MLESPVCHGFSKIQKNDVKYNGTPLIIDIEASGFGSKSYPIEIGVALNSGRQFCTLILPATEWTYWDKEAEKIHHISRDKLKNYGRPIHSVVNQLNNMLNGVTLYSDGWVVDRPWLTTLFHAAGKSMQFNVSPLELILSEKQIEVWHETKEKIMNEMKFQRHRASFDAWIIQETFKKTLFPGN